MDLFMIKGLVHVFALSKTGSGFHLSKTGSCLGFMKDSVRSCQVPIIFSNFSTVFI